MFMNFFAAIFLKEVIWVIIKNEDNLKLHHRTFHFRKIIAAETR